MKYIFTAVLLIAVLACTSNAQQDSPQRDKQSGLPAATAVPKELHSQSATFFKTLMLSNIDDAFSQLLKNSPIREKKEQFQRLISETKRAFQLYGNAQGYERVSDEYVTESLMRLRYITTHDDLPMRWIMTYYKSPKRGWIIINIKFDDEAEYFFEE